MGKSPVQLFEKFLNNSELKNLNVEWLAAYGKKLAGDFVVAGMWEYNGTSWSKITNLNADNSGNTMTDFDLP